MALNDRQQKLKDRFIAAGGMWTDLWHGIVSLDTDYFEGYLNLREQPFQHSVLGRKNQQLILTALESSTSTLFEIGINVHIKAALAAGASPAEIFEVLALTSTQGIDAVTSSVPVLWEVLEEENLGERPALDERRQKLKAEFTAKMGYWSDHWTPVLEMSPDFFEGFTSFAAAPFVKNGGLDRKMKELVYVAIAASTTHRYNERLKVHIRNAVRLGATKEELIDVFELAVMQGIHTPMVGCKSLLEQMK